MRLGSCRQRRAALHVRGPREREKVSAWLRAQFILAGVMGTFAAIGLGLMGVPYFYVVALIAAARRDDPDCGTDRRRHLGGGGRH